MSRPAREVALSSRKLRSLRLASAGPEWEWLLLRVVDRDVSAIPVFKRKGGLLLAVPDGVFTADEIAAGAVGAEIPDLGPTTTLQVAVQGDVVDQTTSVLMFDAPSAIFQHIKVVGTNPRWPEGTIHFREGGELMRVDADNLCALAQEWVEGAAVRESDQYLTALEDEGRQAPDQPGASNQALDAVLTQLHNLASVVNGLQADMGEMRAQASSSSNVPPKPPGALATVAQLAGKAPGTRAKAAPGALARPQDVLAPEELEEETGDIPDESANLDQMMKLALIKMMEKGSKKSKRSKVGLGLGDSSGSDEEDDPLRRLSGAKGTLLQERLRLSMVQHPADYVQTIETLAATALGLAAPSADTMERFVREELPIGNDRNLGYLVWLIVKTIGLMRNKQFDQAHLLLLLGLASVEQFKLDQNWQSAWRMTNLPLPPFQEWRVRDASLAQLRLDHAHSRLVHSTWAAAISARLKDEEVLVKRRGQPKLANPPYQPPAKGGKNKGKGTKAADAEEHQS